jgi:hypothetical protein
MGRSHWRVPYPGVLLRGEGTHHKGDRRIAYAKARHGVNAKTSRVARVPVVWNLQHAGPRWDQYVHICITTIR